MDINKKHFLNNLDIFHNINDICFDNIFNHTKFYFKSKGEILCMDDEPVHSMYIIISGQVKIYRETVDGIENVVDILKSGEYFGENCIFDGDTYQINVQAIEYTEFATIPSTLIKDLVEKDTLFAQALLKRISKKYKEKELDFEHLVVQTAPQRIGCFILGYIEKEKIDIKSNLTLFSLPYDKTLIAARLGMQPETFSRALSRLRDDAGVRISGSNVHIDSIERLSSYVCGACSLEYPCKNK